MAGTGWKHGGVQVPEPGYVQAADGTYLAYQVVGEGSVDIAWQLDFIGNLDGVWESPFDGAWFRSLASSARLILHDRRGTGLSGRNTPAPNLETRAADLRTVLDHVGSRSTWIGGWWEGLAPGILLAATDPDRVRGLIWWRPEPRTLWAPDYPWGSGPEQVDSELRMLRQWGSVGYAQAWAEHMELEEGNRPTDDEILALAKQSRNSCTPDVAVELTRMWWETDLRAVLPTLRVPTLLVTDDAEPKGIEVSKYVGALIPNSEVRVIETGPWPTRETMARYMRLFHDAVIRFTGIEPLRPEVDSVLASVLFTDIVGSTERQATVGDQAWKQLVESHHALVRAALIHWRGVENDTAGDGFYATFEGPARAVRCAMEISERVRELGLEIRAGVHTGECELIDGKPGGIAVSIGARIATRAGPSQVLVSQTVKDLVAGSGLTFADAGEHQLKGVPDRWHLYAVTG
jgi:class 3 adenylate cyclase